VEAAPEPEPAVEATPAPEPEAQPKPAEPEPAVEATPEPEPAVEAAPEPEPDAEAAPHDEPPAAQEAADETPPTDEEPAGIWDEPLALETETIPDDEPAETVEEVEKPPEAGIDEEPIDEEPEVQFDPNAIPAALYDAEPQQTDEPPPDLLAWARESQKVEEETPTVPSTRPPGNDWGTAFRRMLMPVLAAALGAAGYWATTSGTLTAAWVKVRDGVAGVSESIPEPSVPAINGADEPAVSETAEETPVADTGSDAPPEPAPPRVNVELVGPQLGWPEVTFESSTYAWSVEVRNDSEVPVEVTVRIELLALGQTVVLSDEETVRLDPGASRTVERQGEATFDESVQVKSYRIVEDHVALGPVDGGS